MTKNLALRFLMDRNNIPNQSIVTIPFIIVPENLKSRMRRVFYIHCIYIQKILLPFLPGTYLGELSFNTDLLETNGLITNRVFESRIRL